MRNRRVTIKDVAREAGVSPQTVSRVINDRPDVSSETRKQIKDIIAELGYRPSTLAQSLINQKTNVIGVVIAGLHLLGPSRTLSGLADQAEKLGYTLMLKELPSYVSDDSNKILEALLARQVDGIIWAVPEVSQNYDWVTNKLPTLDVPVIFIGMKPRGKVLTISIDEYKGARSATEHLLNQGITNIGHISGPSNWWVSQQREAGWRQSMEDAGIAITQRQIVNCDWSPDGGEKAIQQLFQQFPEMEAVFVANDQMALGVLQYAYKNNLKIPDDLAVVGFDGISESAYFCPPLTTIDLDQHALGCAAVNALVEMIEEQRGGQEEGEGIDQLLPPTLLVRQSSQK